MSRKKPEAAEEAAEAADVAAEEIEAPPEAEEMACRRGAESVSRRRKPVTPKNLRRTPEEKGKE